MITVHKPIHGAKPHRTLDLKCQYREKNSGHVSSNWETVCRDHEAELPAIRNLTKGSFNLQLERPQTYIPPNDLIFKEEARKRGQKDGVHIAPLCKVTKMNGMEIEGWIYRGGHPDSMIEVLCKVKLKELLGLENGSSVTVTIQEYSPK